MTHPPDNTSLYRTVPGYKAVMEQYDRTVSECDVPVNSRYVNTSQGPTHVLISGDSDNQPLVLLHGQNANATSWARWFPALATDNCVFAIDVIGGMGKSAPSRPSKKGPAFGQWCVEVLRALQLENVNMVGASQGCWIIVKAAILAPELLRSSVLMSPAGIHGINFIQMLRMTPSLLFKSPPETARAMLEMVSGPDVPEDPIFLQMFESMLRYFRSEALVPLLRDEELAGLNAPTYLLVGEYERTTNAYKVLQRALNTFPALHLAEIVPGVGHGMIHKEPEWVISRVVEFLRRQAAENV